MAPRTQSSIASLTDALEIGWRLAKDPAQSRWFAPLLLAIDAVLCALIIKTVNYTEIDWTAYMQQVSQFVAGERDYAKIKGDTGPLVYPAVHLYIYRLLYALTDGGANILLAQCSFAILYLCNLGLVMACYRLAKAPPYVYPMLILSKRLHSVYMLRCFNDCWAVGFLFSAIYLFQKRHWAYGAVAFSFGIGVKMSLLVALPAVLILIYQAKGPQGSLMVATYMLQVQFITALPFTTHNFRSYISRAFQLTRVFKYEWTVNWRFLPESTFLSPQFSIGLLCAWVVLLLLFGLTRWTRPLGRSPRDLARLAFANPDPAVQEKVFKELNADFILTTICTSTLIGMLCARSLHYQFFAYIAWTTPFLLHKAGMNPALQWIIWFGQEMAWNVFPPAEITSKIVVGTLAAVVVNVWTSTGEEAVGSVEEMAERVVLENKRFGSGKGSLESVLGKPGTAAGGGVGREETVAAVDVDGKEGAGEVATGREGKTVRFRATAGVEGNL